jgi:FAD/FMN-containing dehydrogenase
MPPEPRPLSAATIRALEASLHNRITGDVDFSAGSRALYATDASNYRQTPIGVVVPRITDDVVETVRTCREHGAAILPRGAGTSLAGQCCNVAVVIDMSRHLRAVVNVDPARQTARVQPGLVLDDLQ